MLRPVQWVRMGYVDTHAPTHKSAQRILHHGHTYKHTYTYGGERQS